MNYTKLDLLLADRQLAEAQGRIARQRGAIAELVRDGAPCEAARELLATLEECLEEVSAHREAIVSEMSSTRPRSWLRLRPQPAASPEV